MLSIFLIIFCVVSTNNGARILAVFPAPFPSHQSVFRPLTQELARRGHQVTVITTDPSYTTSPNLTEIDVHDISYDFRNKYLPAAGRVDDLYDQLEKYFDMFSKIIREQMKNTDLKNLVNDKSQHFDLIIAEAVIRPALVFSHLFKAPVITISSLGMIDLFTDYLGVPSHPLLYPVCARQKLNDLTVWDTMRELYLLYFFDRIDKNNEAKEDIILKNLFGDDVPPLKELKKNVVMLMLNVHHLWEGNRPVPPNVIYLGGLHLANLKFKELPEDLKEYLDTSSQGVIYMSMGSLVMPSLLENIKIVIQTLSKLPYDILLKWDDDYLTNCPSNFKVMKWTPQRELLHHPNIKLFITQGGLQSTDEAIIAGVPLVGIPILGDQWYNVEKYIQLKIGKRIDLETVTEEIVKNAVNTVIGDSSYKENIQSLHRILYDKPMNSLELAVWWVEYFLRHGRDSSDISKHLSSPAAHLSSWEYYEMDFVLVLLSIFLCILFVFFLVTRVVLRILQTFFGTVKLKSS